MSFPFSKLHIQFDTLSLYIQVRLQYHNEGGDSDFNQRRAGVSFPAAGPTAYPSAIRCSAPACKYYFYTAQFHIIVDMIEINILIHVFTLVFVLLSVTEEMGAGV